MKTTIQGHVVSYEQNASRGIRYLTQMIDPKEAKVFFDQAYSRGSADFEDQMGVNYRLTLSGPEYQLIRAQ